MLKNIFFAHKRSVSDSEEQIHPVAPSVNDDEHIDSILCRSILSGVSTIETIRSFIINSVDMLNNEKEKINELNEKNDQVRESLKSLVSFIDDIKSSSTDINTCTDELNDSLCNINANVVDIQKIANQTNIIAINSAIEAARVGTAGRGFSVIAKEVKQLSDDVATSSKNVISLTSSINNNVASVSHHVSHQNEVIENITASIASIIESVSLVVEKSCDMKRVLEHISIMQFLNVVKLDHVLWKMDIYKRIMANNVTDDISSHLHCRLGKWYYGKDGGKFNRLTAFRALENPHERVHAAGMRSLQHFAAGRISAMSEELKKMESSSNEVVHQLEMLANDLNVHGYPQE